MAGEEGAVPPWWTPLALLGLVLLGEVRTWQGYRARAAPSAQDRGSLRLNTAMGWLSLAGGLGAAYGLRAGWAAVPPWAAWTGLALAVAGTALRAWAVAVLGPWFSLTIQVRPGQPVVERGPYRLLRHPSYAGGELGLLGVGLAAGSWVAAVAFLAPWLVAHRYRIRVEEEALLATLGEPYHAYARRTWRLVPFLW